MAKEALERGTTTRAKVKVELKKGVRAITRHAACNIARHARHKDASDQVEEMEVETPDPTQASEQEPKVKCDSKMEPEIAKQMEELKERLAYGEKALKLLIPALPSKDHPLIKQTMAETEGVRKQLDTAEHSRQTMVYRASTD